MCTNENDVKNNKDFSKADYWVFFSIIIVIAPVFVPYLFDLLQGKSINMSKDALDISLLVYSVSCSLLYLCVESTHIFKYLRKSNKIISFISAVFAIIFYIHTKSKNTLPDKIDSFIKIGLFIILYTFVFGYIIATIENKKQESGESNAK